MRKGLLHRRRMMQASGGIDYIYDGLLLHFNVTSYSTQQAIRNKFDGTLFQNLRSGNVTQMADCLYMDAVSLKSTIQYSQIRSSLGTIEAVFSAEINPFSRDWFVLYSSNYSNSDYDIMCLRYGENSPNQTYAFTSYNWRNGNMFVTGDIYDSKDHKISIAGGSSCLFDNQFLPAVANPTAFSTDTNGYPSVGGRLFQTYDSGRFVGNLYSLRIYTRVLSIDEQLHNSAVDYQNFGI